MTVLHRWRAAPTDDKHVHLRRPAVPGDTRKEDKRRRGSVRPGLKSCHLMGHRWRSTLLHPLVAAGGGRRGGGASEGTLVQQHSISISLQDLSHEQLSHCVTKARRDVQSRGEKKKFNLAPIRSEPWSRRRRRSSFLVEQKLRQVQGLDLHNSSINLLIQKVLKRNA